MSNLTEKELAALNEEMNEVSYISLLEFSNVHSPTPSLGQRKTSRKKACIKRFYCEKNFLNKFWLTVNTHANMYNIANVINNNIIFYQYCQSIENFFAENQASMIQDIQQITANQEGLDVSFIFTNLQDKWINIWKNFITSCGLECRSGMISASAIDKIIIQFEDNFFIYSFNKRYWICHDDRSLLAAICKIIFLKDAIEKEYDLDVVLLDILGELKNKAKTFPSYAYPVAIKQAKINMYQFLRKYYIDNGEIRNIKHIYSLENNTEVQKINYSYNNSLFDKKDSSPQPEYAVLMQTLFVLTEGSKKIFDEFAKMLAIVISGPELCRLFRLDCSPVTVITTNNVLFVENFFKSIFSGGLYCTVNPFGTQDLLLNQFWNNKIIEQAMDTRYWGMTQHTVSSLSNPDNTGKYLEDKFYSRYVNVTSIDQNTKKISNEKYFENLISGKQVKGKNKYLGEQKLKSEAHYIFIADSAQDTKIFKNIKYNTVEFSQTMPNIVFIPRWNGKSLKGRALNTLEKDFLLNDVAEYGMKLILDEKFHNLQENTNTRGISDPIEYFITYCCTEVSLEGDNKPSVKNATALQTFNIAYKLFYDILDPKYLTKKFDKNDFGEYDNINISKSDRHLDIAERDRKQGYDKEGETLKDKGVHLIGIIIKPKQDVIDQAEQCKKTLEDDLEIMKKTEFVDFVMGLLNEQRVENLRSIMPNTSN